MTIRVFIVEDHELFASGLRSQLGTEFEVVGNAGTVEDAVAGVLETEPDVVLLDVHLPDGSGADVVERCPGVRFLALSVSDAREDVIAVIRAGARGYVTKSISPTALGDAIGRVYEGDAVFSPLLAGMVLDEFRTPSKLPSEGVLSTLTPREREVLRHIARGYSYKEVARELHISSRTVESHVSAVLKKLQLRNRHALTGWVIDHGPI